MPVSTIPVVPSPLHHLTPASPPLSNESLCQLLNPKAQNNNSPAVNNHSTLSLLGPHQQQQQQQQADMQITSRSTTNNTSLSSSNSVLLDGVPATAGIYHVLDDEEHRLPPASGVGNTASTGSQSRAMTAIAAEIAHAEFEEDQELRQLLDQSGLGQYASIFVEHEVDLGTFRKLKESHLMEMGLHRVGTRIKFTALIAETNERMEKDRSGSHEPSELTSTALLLQPQPHHQQQHTPSVRVQDLQAPLETPPPQPTPQPPESVVTERSKSRPGEIPYDELTIQDCIGRGSFGAVYR